LTRTTKTALDGLNAPCVEFRVNWKHRQEASDIFLLHSVQS
jgi:hypothetical protein